MLIFFKVPARHFVKQCMWADHEVPFILWHLILGFNGVTALHGLRLNFGHFTAEVIFPLG